MVVLNIQNKQRKVNIGNDYKKVVKEVVEECINYCGLKDNQSVSVVFTDDSGICKFNKEYRGMDSTTDVLSFTMMEEDPSDGIVYLGDIIISIETALRQASEYGHSPDREIAFLVSHGMFHLLGYDHKDEESLKIMIACQEQVLRSIGYIRDSKNKHISDIYENIDTYVNDSLAAMNNSYSPYSKFSVGACAVVPDGRAYTGCNVENSSFGGTVCAERTAVVKAISDGYRKIALLIVCGDSDTPVFPCGICLQFLTEFAAPQMKIICCDKTGKKREEYAFSKLLPHRFGGIEK